MSTISLKEWREHWPNHFKAHMSEQTAPAPEKTDKERIEELEKSLADANTAIADTNKLLSELTGQTKEGQNITINVSSAQDSTRKQKRQDLLNLAFKNLHHG